MHGILFHFPCFGALSLLFWHCLASSTLTLPFECRAYIGFKIMIPVGRWFWASNTNSWQGDLPTCLEPIGRKSVQVRPLHQELHHPVGALRVHIDVKDERVGVLWVACTAIMWGTCCAAARRLLSSW